MKPDPNDQYGEEQANRIAYLVAGFLRQTLSEKEHDELDEWVEASDENQRLFEELIDPANIEKGLKEYDVPDTEAALKKIKSKISFTQTQKEGVFKRRTILRYSIAASILLMAGLILFFVLNKRNDNPPIAGTDKQDIQGGGNKAVLILTNGKTIDLTTAKNGLIDSTEGNDVLKTADGQLSYEEGKGSDKEEGKGEHILMTPAGGQYAVTLPDGTRVWLNASSSLKYPVVFDEKERVVELTGEGYFEASPQPSPGGEGDRKIPFTVKLRNGAQIKVVGTHFNINAYSDEPMIETTLLEGKVTVYGDNADMYGKELMPGQKASILKQGHDNNSSIISVMNGVDTSMAIAWKNGKFQFKDAPIENVMRQVSRWYNAEIMYEGKVDYHFNATGIYRNEPLSKLLAVLEATNNVHFKIEGKRVIVSP